MSDENGQPMTARTYLENYKILSEAAQELRDQEVADIDKLVPLVDRALAAYSACKSRIEAVEAMLAERLSGGMTGRSEEVS